MISETQTRYGSGPRRQGRSRWCASYQSNRNRRKMRRSRGLRDIIEIDFSPSPRSQPQASVPHEELLFIHAGRYRYIEEAHHHFFISLASPPYFDIRIRIVGIVFGVVVPADRLQLGVGLQEARLSQSIAELPVKVVMI